MAMPSKQFEHLQESSLAHLKAMVPLGCPLLVTRAEPAGFTVSTFDERDALTGRYQLVATWIAGYVAAWRRLRPAVDAVSTQRLPRP